MHSVAPMGRLYTIWIEERDKDVWHGVLRRVNGATYEAGCGWELNPLRGGRVWPMKQGDLGPPLEDRCHSCVDAQ